jgi:hypothetical protein
MKILKILTPLLFLVAMFVGGCGSDSKSDPSFDSSSPDGSNVVNGYELVNITVPFDVNYAGERKQFKVQLLQYGVPVIGATIKVAGLPAEFGIVSNASADTDNSGYAIFDYVGADPLLNGVYALDVFYEVVTTTPDTNTTTSTTTTPEYVVTQLQINVQESSDPTGNSAFSLVNVTNPFLVTYAGEEKTFSVQVLNQGTPVKDEEVSVATLPTNFGLVSSATVISNESGYAVFNYIASDPLVNGSYDLEIFHADENGSRISNNLHIVIDEGAQEFAYQLTNASTPVILTEPNQKGDITVYLVDNNGVGVKDKVVNMSILDNAYGTLTSTVSTTDESGKASFGYIASDNIVGLSSTLLTASFTENGLSTTQQIEVKSESTFDYKLVNLTTPLIVKSSLQESLITVQLVNKANQPMVGKDVTITTIDSSYGSVSPAVAKTDTSGTATFTYKAPENILGLSTTQATISFTENGLTISEILTISMEVGFDYKLTNLTTPIIIKAPDEKHNVTVQLVDINNQGVQGKDIAISAIDVNYGFITPTVSTTDASGVATFEYTASSSLSGLSTTTATVSFSESGLTISELLTLSVETAFDYKFSNPTSPLIVQTAKQESDVGVYLVNSAGIGIPDKDVSITTIDRAYGSITPTTIQTDESGRAVFKYTAPESLDGLKSTTAKFSFTESDLTIYQDMEIQIIPSGIGDDYQLVNVSPPVSIISPDQSEVMEVQLTLNGFPVIDSRACTTDSTVTVDCVIPEAIPRAYGRITDAGGSTAKDGYIYYSYVGPNEVDKADVGTEYIFNFIYFDKDGKAKATAPMTIQMNF